MQSNKPLLLIAFIMLFSVVTKAQITVNASAGTPTGSYSTLKLAFDAVNFGIHQGNITILVNGSTTETTTAVLNPTGGSANYTKVIIMPTAAATISGNIFGPIVSLAGADYVTIDGRIGGTGSTRSLTLQNNSSAAGTYFCTLLLYSGAQYDTVRYINVKSVSTAITFDQSSTIFNMLDNNDLGSIGTNAQVQAINFGIGSYNVISNNLIHDFSTYGIASSPSGSNSNCIITGNSFYQTITIASQAVGVNVSGTNTTIARNYFGGTAPYNGGGRSVYTYSFTAISGSSNIDSNIISNIQTGGGFKGISSGGNVGLVHGNIIGSATDTGAIRAWSAIGIELTGGSCQNNIIGGITCLNAGLTGISLSGGSTSCLINNNIIGGSLATRLKNYGITPTIGINLQNAKCTVSQNTISNIYSYNSAANNTIGINCVAQGGVSILNNQINEIHATSSTRFGGISVDATPGNTSPRTISGNTISNLSLASSGIANVFGISSSTNGGTNYVMGNTINNVSYLAAGTLQVYTYGIGLMNNLNTSAQVVRNNTISNITSASTHTVSYVAGIFGSPTFPGPVNIDSNHISFIIGASTDTAISGKIAAQGIALLDPLGSSTIIGNDVHDISNSSSATTTVVGINVSDTFSVNKEIEVRANNIYNINNPNAASGTIAGLIVAGNGGLSGTGKGRFTLKNNMVSLSPSSNTQVYGIFNVLPATLINIYYNSLYLGGTSSGNNISAALSRVDYAYTSVDIRDNLLMNTRTGGTAGHYAVINNNLLTAAGWATSNYNNLYTANPNTLASWGGVAMNFADYRAASLKDSCSVSQTVNFVNTANGNLHLQNTATNATLAGSTITGITTDFDGDPRNQLPAMGADELLLPQQPTTIITANGPITFCNGGSVVLTSSFSANIQWRQNGIDIPGATSGTLTVTQSGIYTVYIANSCFSYTSNAITVTILPGTATADTFQASICNGSSYTLGSQTLTTAGTYTENFVSVGGCDSMVTIILSVTTIDNTVNLAGTTLIAVSAGTYQWMDCDNNYAPIAGATAQSFTPAGTGNYAVEIINSGCQDTSACFNIIISGVSTVIHHTLEVYPNPFADVLIVKYLAARDHIVLFDESGRKAINVTVSDQNIADYKIVTRTLSAGHYLLYVSDRDGTMKQSFHLVKR